MNTTITRHTSAKESDANRTNIDKIAITSLDVWFSTWTYIGGGGNVWACVIVLCDVAFVAFDDGQAQTLDDGKGDRYGIAGL